MAAINAVAGGTISPSVFVKVSTAADNTVLQCGTGDFCIGVSTPSQKVAPIPLASGVTYAAASGDYIMIFGFGDVCNLSVGSGGVTHGDLVKPDANGAGVTAASAEYYGAVALETAASGTLCRVVVLPGYKK